MASTNVDIIIQARDQASAVFQRFGATANTTGQRLASAFRTGGLAAGIMLGGMTALGKAAVDVAGDFEQNRIAFETMLGSGEKAGQLLKEISDFAIKTPFELPGVVSGAKQLLAMGGSAENVLPHLKALGDVAAGTGTPLERLILNFGQVRLQGKLTGRELRDFAVGGVPLIDELAKNLGVAKDQISDMVSAGEIGFPEVEKAFKSMTSEGGKFSNLMQKQSKTFAGVMSNIKDSITRSLAEIVGISLEEGGKIREGSLFDILKKAADAFLIALDKAVPKIIEFTKWVQRNQEVIGAIAGGILGLLVVAIGALVLAFASAIGIALAFVAAGAVLGAAIVFVVKHFNDWKQAVIGAWEAMKTFFVDTVPKAISDVVSSIINFFSRLPEETDRLFIKIFTEHIPFAVGFAAQFLIDMIPKIYNTVIEWFSKLPGQARDLWNQVKDNIIIAVLSAATFISDEISEWPDRIFNFLKSIPDMIGGIFEDLRDAIVEWLLSGPSSAWKNIEDFGNKVMGVFDGIRNAARETLDAVSRSFGEGLRAAGAGRQAGGIVPGPVGSPQTVLAHGGEEIVPFERRGSGGGSNIVLNVNVGIYAGTRTEMRNLAREIYGSLVEVAAAQNKSVAEMMGR